MVIVGVIVIVIVIFMTLTVSTQCCRGTSCISFMFRFTLVSPFHPFCDAWKFQEWFSFVIELIDTRWQVSIIKNPDLCWCWHTWSSVTKAHRVSLGNRLVYWRLYSLGRDLNLKKKSKINKVCIVMVTKKTRCSSLFLTMVNFFQSFSPRLT